MIERRLLERIVRDVIAHHHDTLPDELAAAMAASGYAQRTPIGLAIGKAALAMARAFGPVERGLIVSPHDDREGVPEGWQLLVSSHPIVDERAVVAGDAAIELVERAPADRVVVALISGGASALVESPLVPLAEFVGITSALARLGAPIAEVNTVRIALSAIKGGELAARSAAPVVTLVVSDVIDDSLEVIGSGLTVGPWLRPNGQTVDHAARRATQRKHALRVLRPRGLTIPAVLSEPLEPTPPATRSDFARVVVPMQRLSRTVRAALVSRAAIAIRWSQTPLVQDVREVARHLGREIPAMVFWGEPTLVLPPDHGSGGRMQQLALELASLFAGTNRSALAIGTDGMDGPAPVGRPAPAGAYIDGTTWDAIRAAGIDPQAALDRRDAGTALAAVGALVITGPTGVNHADLVVIG